MLYVLPQLLPDGVGHHVPEALVVGLMQPVEELPSTLMHPQPQHLQGLLDLRHLGQQGQSLYAAGDVPHVHEVPALSGRGLEAVSHLVVDVDEGFDD
jgi:hypothetical protein